MRSYLKLGAAVAILAAAVMSASSAGADETGWPYTGKLVDGSTFTLNPSIAAKIKAQQPINYVFSYGTASTDLYSQQMKAGYDETLAEANKIYPLNSVAIAPATGYDPAVQISQIEAKYNANQVDCLSIAVDGADTFTQITKTLMSDGIPVFTNGAPTNGNELGQFTQVPEKEGAQAADVVLDWMAKNNKQLKVFAVSSGNIAATWAQGRMIAFENRIKEKIPDARFVADHTNALATTFDAPQQYDAYAAFFLAHPDVQLMVNVDQGAGKADKAINDAGRKGQIYTVGWNVTDDQLDGIADGTQIALFDQKWGDQSGFGALACATFLSKGEIMPNTQKLLVIGPEQVDESRAELHRLLGQ